MTPSSHAPDVRLALVTGPDADLRRLGERLVNERLAACVNVLDGVSSVYRWEGAVERAAESLALFKTTAGRLDELRERVLSLHPYDEPEFLSLEVDGGSPSYLRWVAESVSEE